MTEINDIAAGRLSKIVPKKQKKSSESTEEQQAPQPRAQDSVEIGQSRTQRAEKSDVSITKKDMNRYTKILEDMPDVRENEIARVQAVLQEDGYGPDALTAVVDRLMDGELL